ncbi:hypothetical protein B0O99DRAFT_745043 [Bisporella sp. PMI_857]|nr:hypothetical protein B0O99DRAFT_745043 [Bisporella sp. PMI_857]
MAPSEKPTFVLLRARLPAKDAKRLLGRFVTHPARPLDNSEPKNPLSRIKTAPVVIEEKSASMELSAGLCRRNDNLAEDEHDDNNAPWDMELDSENSVPTSVSTEDELILI